MRLLRLFRGKKVGRMCWAKMVPWFSAGKPPNYPAQGLIEFSPVRPTSKPAG